MTKQLFRIIALSAWGSVAHGAVLVAVHPGVMCTDEQALARLTLPDGSSRTSGPNASPRDQAMKMRGGCIDIAEGSVVSVLNGRRNTSIVTFDPGDGRGQRRYVVPNIDFQPAPGVSAAPSANAAPDTAGAGAAATPDAPNPAAAAASRFSPANTAALFASPRVDPVTVALVYDKLSNTTPDFEAYAEQSERYQHANSFDRESVLHQQEASLKQLYARLTTATTFTGLVQVGLQQYDPSAGGYSLDWSEAQGLDFRDPAGSVDYSIHLDNYHQFNTIPVADETAARAFARKFGLNTAQGAVNGVIWQLVFRLTDVVPSTEYNRVPIRARIIAAVILDGSNRVMYRFSPAPDETAPAPAASADIQGITLGMPAADAETIAARGRPVEHDARNTKGKIYLAAESPMARFAQCGDVSTRALGFTSGALSLDTGEGDQKDCVGIRLAQTGDTSVVSEAYSRQVVALSPGDVRNLLVKKYGRPASVGADQINTTLRWVLPNPARGGERVLVSADLGKVDRRQTWFLVTMKPYENPNGRAEPAGSAPSQPKL